MEQKKLSPSRQKKEQIVAKLSGKVAKAKGLVFTNYQGLTHKQLEGLKKAVKSLNAEFVVTKNTLLLRSLQLSTSNSQLFASASSAKPNEVRSTINLQNATATLFLYGDPHPPLKEIAKTIKQFNLPNIKFGILDGEALTSEQVLKISTLPSRETLLIQLVFSLKSPISGLHRALSWNLQKFVMTLKAIEKTKA